jgi:hypothetical protein
VTRAARWLPAGVAAAYLVTVAVTAPHIVRLVYWDTDVAAPFVLAERLRGHGTVFIPHFASWSVLWTLLATRNLPGHMKLWEALGYPFALAGAAAVGWATARVAGRWAGVTAAAVAIVVGPYVLRSQLTVIYHVLPPFTAALLAAYLVTLGRRRSRSSILVALVIGLVAGVNAAGDGLTWPAAVVPFAIGAGVFYAATRRSDIAARAGVTLAAAITSGLAVPAVMHHFGYKVVGLELTHAHVSALAGNVRHLGRMVALVAGANYALPGGYPPEPLRLAIAILALVGVVAAFVAGVIQLIRRGEALRRAYACYWAASVALLSLSFVLTTNAVALGAGSANYLLSFVPAAGAGVALLASSSPRAQIATGIAVAVVGVSNLVGVAQGHADSPKGAIGEHKTQIVEALERDGVRRGYAGYWDAQNLSWQSGMRLLIAPVERCGDGLCPFNFSTIESWYSEQPGRSFLIVDPTGSYVTTPPPIVARATASHRFGQLRVYVFPFDLARYIHPS